MGGSAGEGGIGGSAGEGGGGSGFYRGAGEGEGKEELGVLHGRAQVSDFIGSYL